MLLVILFAGCLTSCLTQTTTVTTIVATTPAPTTSPATTLAGTTSTARTTSSIVLSRPPSQDTGPTVVAILQAAVQSTLELNETTIGPFLQQLRAVIRSTQDGLSPIFTLTVKNITRV